MKKTLLLTLCASAIAVSAGASATTGRVSAAEAESVAQKEAAARGFERFEVRELELEHGYWKVEGTAHSPTGLTGKLELRIDAATGAVITPRARAAAAARTGLTAGEAAVVAEKEAAAMGYADFEIREIERDDGRWEIEGTASFRSGLTGKLELEIDPATGTVVKVRERGLRR